MPSPPARLHAASVKQAILSRELTPSPSYSSEPAPMGVGDFGMTAGFSPYSYWTPRFLATARINALTTNGPSFDPYSVSFQLNVVLVLTQGSKSASYWIQNVPFLDTSTQTFQMIDNVWNLSSSSSLALPASSVRGNGTIYTSGNGDYYADVAGSSYPGNDVQLLYPANFSVEVVASTIAGLTHVGFQYDDGYGWVTYDNVTFPSAKGWASQGFLVDGASTPPAGVYYDAEWVLGGPGGGSSTSAGGANLSLSLQEFNGNNFEAVPNAFNFGGDTAEAISNVVASLAAGSSAGTPGAELTNGSGALTALYGPSNYAVLNASSIPVPGALSIDGTAVNYTSAPLNVSILPGSYRLDLRAGSVSDRVNLSVGGGVYIPTSGRLNQLTFTPTLGLPMTSATVSGGGFTPGLGLTVSWLPGNATECAGNSNGAGSFNCTFTVPRASAGWYVVRASNRSSQLATGLGSFLVTSNLSVGIRVARTSGDALTPFNFSAQASGGFAPYSMYQWDYGDGTLASTTGPSSSHDYRTAGAFTIRVRVGDTVGNSAQAALSVNVTGDPGVTTPTANRSSADVGQSVAFSTNPYAGSGGDRFQWAGLPGSCNGTTTVRCSSVPSAGTFRVSVSVTDSEGFTATSGTLPFPVFLPPQVAPPLVNRTTADVGQGVSFTAAIVGPGPGIAGYRWTWGSAGSAGLSCSPTSSATINCSATAAGSFAVSVAVTDANGESGSATSLAVRVLGDPTVDPPTFGPAFSDVGVVANGSARASGGSGGFTYAWAGVPGCASNASTMVCAPTLPGLYNVTVTVLDSNRFTVTSDPTTLEVNQAMSVLILGAAAPPVSGQSLSLAANVSGGTGPFHYAWAFGDGTRAAGVMVVHTYTSSGTFAARIWVNDSAGGSVLDRLTITVGIPPTIPWYGQVGPYLPVLGGIAAVLVGVALIVAWRRKDRPPKPAAIPRMASPSRGWEDESSW
ncbi:MAG: thermopsin family protease [Thermoplasmata archaeon]|nr:thermopsin family protease [Thermoplasmata archaeon]